MIESQQQPNAVADEYRVDLAEALSDPALDEFTDGVAAASEEARLAAYELAAALGTCRLLHIEPGDELDGMLPPHMATVAAEVLGECLEKWTEEAKSLPASWEDRLDQTEADSLCSDLLDSRMECLGVEVAISEAYLDAYDTKNATLNALKAEIEKARAAIAKFDDQMEKVADLLSTLAATNYFTNGRALFQHFVPEEPLPWWLDGRIERYGKQIDRMIDPSMAPDVPDDWDAAPLLVPPERWSTASWPECIPVAMAASAGLESAAAADVRTTRYVWESPAPNLEYRAEMTVPITPEAGDATPLRLVFQDKSEQPLTALAGRTVSLATCRAQIGPEGFAVFLYGDLRNAGTDLRLLLNPGAEEWRRRSVTISGREI